MDTRIVIATLNSEHLLRGCMSSVYNSTSSTKFEIVVIDNASTDNTVAMIKSNFPKVKLIQNKKNRGAGSQGKKQIS